MRSQQARKIPIANPAARVEWLGRHAHDGRAGAAIHRARDGEESASFRATDGVVWHLRRVNLVEAG